MKQYKFKSKGLTEVIQAVELFKKLGYTAYHNMFNIIEAVGHGGLCTWSYGKITSGYLKDSDQHEDITLEQLKKLVCNKEKDDYYPVILSDVEIKWEDVFMNKKIDNTIYILIGVQFTKTIYPFKDNHYVHNIIRDKDGDVCVVDQYGVDYKLRDVEFYVCDEHNGTMTYQQYSKFVSI